jgi:surface carbohydrate biosynthesis protein
MARHVDIVYLFEKALRELDVACLLKHLLESRHGLSVEIVQQNSGFAAAARAFRPKVVLLPFCYQQRSNNAYLCTWRRSTFFNLTWEQLFYPGNRKAKTPRGEFAVRHVLHHAWSGFYAELLREQGVPPEHIFVNGNLALALYREPYRRFFKGREELARRHGLDAGRPWVFFPENYNWAFYEKDMLDQMVRDGQTSEQVAAMRDFSCRSFEAAMRWCAALAGRGGVELVVRPRPATMPDEFRRRVEEVVGPLPKGFRVSQAETVRDWILASDAVVSSYSTSLIESAVAGRPAFMLEPYPLPDSLRQDWHRLLPHVTTEAEFVEGVTAVRDAGRPLGEWAQATLLSQGDAILNLVDRIAAVRRREVPVPRPPSPRHLLAAPRPGTPWWLEYVRLKRHYRRVARSGHASIIPEYVFDRDSVAEAPGKVARWREVLGNGSVR